MKKVPNLDVYDYFLLGIREEDSWKERMERSPRDETKRIKEVHVDRFWGARESAPIDSDEDRRRNLLFALVLRK